MAFSSYFLLFFLFNGPPVRGSSDAAAAITRQIRFNQNSRSEDSKAAVRGTYISRGTYFTIARAIIAALQSYSHE